MYEYVTCMRTFECMFVSERVFYDLHKEDEVLEGSVEMRFLAKLHHFGEVLVVDVRVHAEQPFQDCLRHGQKVLRKRHACGHTTLALYTVFRGDHSLSNSN